MEMSAPELSASMNPLMIKRHSEREQGRKEVTNLCTGLGDGAQVVDEVSLGHADTGVADGEKLVLLVRSDADEKLLARVEDRGVRQGCVTDFVEGIGAVGDQLSEEDLLVRVERVW